MYIYSFKVGSVAEWPHFWEIVAHSVYHMFSKIILTFLILVISCFGAEGWILVLIALIPDLCILFTLTHTLY